MRNADFGLHPASNQATSSSRLAIGVMSIWSRAMRRFRQKGRELTRRAQASANPKRRRRSCRGGVETRPYKREKPFVGATHWVALDPPADAEIGRVGVPKK